MRHGTSLSEEEARVVEAVMRQLMTSGKHDALIRNPHFANVYRKILRMTSKLEVVR